MKILRRFKTTDVGLSALSSIGLPEEHSRLLSPDPGIGNRPLKQARSSPPKTVVCFAGSRDHYQVALALAEAGLLEKLVTDLYLEPGSIPFRNQIGKRFPKFLARYNAGL
jgi:hypothetical protein